MNEAKTQAEKPKTETKAEPPAEPEKPPLPVFGFRTTEEPADGYEDGFPKVYFSVYERQPPVVVKNSAEDALMDKMFWFSMRLPVEKPAAKK